MNTTTWFRALSAVALAGSLFLGASPSRADHRGALGVLNSPTTNINDAYAFVDPNNPSMVVLAMTVNGFTPAGLNPTFAPECLYQFKIDNTGDFVEDLVIQIVFDAPTLEAFGPVQGFTIIGPVKPTRVGGIDRIVKTRTAPFTGTIVNVPTTGPNAGKAVNTFTTTGNGMSIFCGLRDDAFIFDEIFFRNILRGTLATPVPLNSPRATPGIDFYARLNCSTIAIELPSAMLTGTLTNAATHKQINVWATTSLPAVMVHSLRAKRGEPPLGAERDVPSYVQHDRAAHAAVSTFLIDDANKDAFSVGQPKDDAKFFTAVATDAIKKLQLDPTSQAATTALAHELAIRFPDVLRLDVTSTSGYQVDNGRRPQDDAISIEMGLLTVGAVTNQGIPGSDGHIGGNDAISLTSFPFFAPPHLPAETVPARN